MTVQPTSLSASLETEPKPTDVNDSIRGQYLSEAELRELGASLAATTEAVLPGYVPFEFIARQRDNEREILAAYRSTLASVKVGETITPAAEWLIDNHHVIEANIREVQRDLPLKFYRQLPVIRLKDGGSMPRSFALAWLYVAHTHSTVSLDSLSALVEGFQTRETLQIGEIWAIPSILRFALIENLRRISHRVERARRMRKLANETADRLLKLKGDASCRSILDEVAVHTDDNTFAAQLLYRLRDGTQTSKEALGWLEDRLEARGSDAEEVLVAEHNRLASGNVSMGNIVRSLRRMDDIEWSMWFEDMSHVDKLLREGSDFGEIDFASRDLYRDTVETLARYSGKTEIEVTETVLRMAAVAGAPGADAVPGAARRNNIGFYLAGPRRLELEAAIGYRPRLSDRIGRAYRKLDWLGVAGPIAILTLFVLWAGGLFLAHAGISTATLIALLVLFALPASEAANGLFHAVATLVLKPTNIVGYEFKQGMPADARTLVAVPCLISSKDNIDELLRNLEVHHLADPDPSIYFALVSDWTDSKDEETKKDRELFDYAKSEIAALNARYAEASGEARFFLLHRARLYNPAEGVWMGWERKRGKLHELNLLLRGDQDTTFFAPETPLPADIKYVMTLDSDTRITRDAVTKLVGKLSHPLNEPVIDQATGAIRSGYAILQPRVTPSLTTGEEASAFQRIFSVNRGMDPYVFTVSDVYQDLFGEGTFTGKGLYHIDAFEAALKDRIPENVVLSHDLLEGSIARAGLATDVELVEDFPIRYEVEMSRQHRWARGDWQLLPYIFGTAGKVSMLGRFKMFDNLRRSATPVAWLLASILGWCLMGAGAAAIWQAALIFSLFVAPTLSLINGALPRRSDIVARAHLNAVFSEISAANAQVALRIVFIAHGAWTMVDAIARTLYRVLVSRKHLLEWRTAAQVHSGSRGRLSDYFRSMWQAPAIALVALVLTLAAGHGGVIVAIPFALLWALSPLIAWFVSQSAETEDSLRVSDHEKAELRKIARRTWRFFEAFTNEENHYLPPDNFQETPVPVVAHRTSPTNIGVYLLSTISARDFGWIGLAEAATRLEQTLDTLDRLEKYRGHILNWFNTKTLEPLHPKYVSAVDSGNLAGHLVAVSSACAEWAKAPSAHLYGGIDGIGDTAAIVSECLQAIADDRKTVRPLRRRVEERLAGFQRAIETLKREPEFVSIRTINLTVLAREIHRLTVNLDHEMRTPESHELVEWAQALFRTCEAHVADSVVDPEAVDALRQRLVKLRDRTRQLAFDMDFSFLLREDRRLLSIGYRLDSGELDEACYDLLASEARLASLFAIAKGDVPTEHWFKLGRTVVPIGARAALVSWSGSMFEYLMPPLVMQERQGGILNQSNNLIVKRQISYGKSLGIPWGISEAAFNARDHDLNYQYSNFGVPSLGLKRGLGQDAVIAPYASLLASQYAPREALSNLERLRKLGALGRFGFHDAVDFTPTRVPEGQTCAVVENYMAHHQGMSIAAVANVVFNGRLRDRFHADPVIEAAELLLQEKAPRDIPVLTSKREAGDASSGGAELERPEMRMIANPAEQDRAIALLSNGHYSLMLSATGTGYARWNGQQVTRWRPDPAEDDLGLFIFLRDVQTNEWWSATAAPRRVAGEKTVAIFGDDKAEFHKTVGDLRSELECIVAVEGDAEGRKITLFNDGDRDRHIEVTSYAEVVMTTEEADNAHPLFSKMFVRTEIAGSGDVIHAMRNKRGPNDADMHVAHLIVGGGQQGRETEAETDRRAFIGRGRSLSNAAAFDAGSRLSGSDGFTLDPILSLRRTVRVPAGKKISLIFWTIAAPSRPEAEALIERYRHLDSFQHETVHAWTRSQVQLRFVGISSQEAANFQMLARYLVYPDMALRSDAETVKSGLAPQSALWPLAISGDYPIFALRLNDEMDLDIARQALRAQEYLRSRGLMADLVIVNEKASSYAQDLQNALDSMCENARMRGQALGPRQHIFAVRRDLMDARTYNALISAARVVLHARNGNLADQIARASELTNVVTRSALIAVEGKVADVARAGSPQRSLAGPEAGSATGPALTRSAEQPTTALAAPVSAGEAAPVSGEGLSFWNGYGGFAEGGRDYVVRLPGGGATPHPWINVIANEAFGFHVSAEGAGFTWSRNSRDYQLTPWSNDPVINRPGEAFYVVDLDTKRVIAPIAALSSDPSALYEARHGLGVSRFITRADGLEIELAQCVHPADPVKFSRLSIRNTGTQARRLRVYGYVEWVLGNNRARTAPFIESVHRPEVHGLIASNRYSIDYSERAAFFAVSGEASSYTADRRAFFGTHGTVRAPAAVLEAQDLSRSTEVDGDPCAALAADMIVMPDLVTGLTFVLGDAAGTDAAADLAARHRDGDVEALVAETRAQWESFTGAFQVKTPDVAFDHMVNAWLPYQALSCRVMARSAFYQASGAFGFRDQLQDTLALLIQDPKLARRQIVNAAGRQFIEGDVQHWWLPSTGAGVRTMISDDVVWLGYGVAHYVRVTGDRSVLDEEIAFIEGPSLEPGQHDAFFQPDVSHEKASLYEHAARALDLAVARTGRDGLPLILGGDWNDGMNRVGEAGRGESVWLGWFLLATLEAFGPIASARGDAKRAEAWAAHATRLRSALEGPGWDGDYYRRGTYDDGTPLGSAASDECRIDSIAQSWSVLSGQGEPKRSAAAMDAVLAKLVDGEGRFIRLFTPPFEKTTRDPGYIRGYPPGVRENGGQYTHAAAWVVYALAELGRGDDAYRCFEMLNPITHAADRAGADLYRTEPYAVAADIYSEGERRGRGGWTWYTGSAGWLYRAAVEGILGIRREGPRLFVRPALPSGWPGYTATIVIDGRSHAIEARRGADGTVAVSVDGEPVSPAEGVNLLAQPKGGGQPQLRVISSKA